MQDFYYLIAVRLIVVVNAIFNVSMELQNAKLNSFNTLVLLVNLQQEPCQKKYSNQDQY